MSEVCRGQAKWCWDQGPHASGVALPQNAPPAAPLVWPEEGQAGWR